jgi:hypothetical protein
MPSPFPGTDPYLENPVRWPDVHQRLITYIADALQPQVRPRYNTHMGERVYVVQQARSLYPDVMLIQHPLRETTARLSSAVALRDSTSTPDTPVILALEPADLLDYHPPPPAPLSPEEAAWLDGLLKGKSLR